MSNVGVTLPTKRAAYRASVSTKVTPPVAASSCWISPSWLVMAAASIRSTGVTVMPVVAAMMSETVAVVSILTALMVIGIDAAPMLSVMSRGGSFWAATVVLSAATVWPPTLVPSSHTLGATRGSGVTDGIGVSFGVLGAVACWAQATRAASTSETRRTRRNIDSFMNAVHLCEKIHFECIIEMQNAQPKSCVYLITVHQITHTRVPFRY